MPKDFIDNILDSIFDEKWVGRRGEKLTERELKWVKLFGRKGMTLRNVYIPKDNDQTSEIDVVYITQKGIFVFESKNYSGWIFGDEDSQYWTVMLPNRLKNSFYNPIKQNRTHMKWLSRFVGEEIPLFSIIVFSERCELKKITVENPDVHVIKRDKTYVTVRNIWENAPDMLSDEDVVMLYEKLKNLTNEDEAVKLAHIENIEKKYKTKTIRQNTATEVKNDEQPAPPEPEKRICPRCGKELILRTAKKGENAGTQFYGCSGFPNCRFIEKL